MIARAALVHLDLIGAIRPGHVFPEIQSCDAAPDRCAPLASALLCTVCYMAFSEHNFSGALATWKGVCVSFLYLHASQHVLYVRDQPL